MIEAIAKRKSIRSFADRKVEAGHDVALLNLIGIGLGPGTPGQTDLAQLLGLPENVKPYSIVGIGYPDEDADLEATDRFDAGRIHYNKY